MRYVELLARNVFISPKIVKQLDEFKSKCRNANAKHWIDTVYRRYLINEYSDVEQITHYTASLPAWVKKSLDSDNEVYTIDKLDRNQLNHFADYLNTLPETSDLTRMSYPQFLSKLQKWEKSFSKKIDKSGEIKVIHQYTDGFKLVQILDKDGLRYEGSNMNHCVGDYWKDVKQGTTAIYSIRDKENKPHVTIELDLAYKSIEQIQGKNNTPPTKYIKYILEILNNNYIKHERIVEDVIFDLKLIKLEDDYVTKDTFQTKLPNIKKISYLSLEESLEFPDSLEIKKLILLGKGNTNRPVYDLKNCKIKSLKARNCIIKGKELTIDVAFLGNTLVEVEYFNCEKLETVSGTSMECKGIKGKKLDISGTVYCQLIECDEVRLTNTHYGVVVNKIKAETILLDNLNDRKIICDCKGRIELNKCKGVTIVTDTPRYVFNTANDRFNEAPNTLICNNVQILQSTAIFDCIGTCDELYLSSNITYPPSDTNVYCIPKKLKAKTVLMPRHSLEQIKMLLPLNIHLEHLGTKYAKECKELYPNIKKISQM
jgi:hypothetical protein